MIVGVGAEGAGGPAGHPLRGLEALRVDVVQDDVRIAERGGRQHVAQEVPRELDAAGADEDDPRHRDSVDGGAESSGRTDVRMSK